MQNAFGCEKNPDTILISRNFALQKFHRFEANFVTFCICNFFLAKFWLENSKKSDKKQNFASMWPVRLNQQIDKKVTCCFGWGLRCCGPFLPKGHHHCCQWWPLLARVTAYWVRVGGLVAEGSSPPCGVDRSLSENLESLSEKPSMTNLPFCAALGSRDCSNFTRC